MAKCSSCGSEILEASRFCPSCGVPAGSDAFATQTVAVPTPRAASRTSSGSQLFSRVRFAPGTLLAGRYRIVALLGKGGMGEVYRADDLTVEQQVALKFLPESVAHNPEAIARFRNEVRVARQVSHPNVCRVYDLGDIAGHYFLSMEYVDGEDLGSLLRRIGRLPYDKGLEIARKLCAGLAAAHEKGVLHRDLKPGNVMLDGRGQVLLTDFGLAGLAGEFEGAEVRNGTPAYMAPEQLSGEEVTVKSDIYSLGLVLYEIFTGKLPFESETLAGLMRARAGNAPVHPTTLVKDLDPAVERVILRCLEAKPAMRPSSTLAVAASLPGGDPLAAALAAGETPSPAMVAAAGEGAGLAPRVAVPLFAAILAAMVVCGLLARHISALERIQPQYSPDVLSQKARDIIQRLGYTDQFADDAFGYSWYDEFINYANSHDKPNPAWDKILSQRPAMLRFWYRQSPGPMTAVTYHTDALTPGIVTPDDPPVTLSGMNYLELDSLGHLMYFEARPPQVQEPATQPPPPDWNALFAAAGLDPAEFQPEEPLWTWLSTSDTRMAWKGKWPGSDREMRVEAATLRGKPVGFYVAGPWSGPWRMAAPDTTHDVLYYGGVGVITVLIILGAAWLARRNLIQDRGDRQGAWRLAFWIFSVQMALWLTRGHFVVSMGPVGMFFLALSTSVFYSVAIGTVYLALEPYVRRRWPHTLIGWSRVLTGRARDPVVGREVLFGIAVATTWMLVARALQVWSYWQGFGTPDRDQTDILLGTRSVIGLCIGAVPQSIRDALFSFFLILLLRVLLRNQWLAGATFVLIFTVLRCLGSSRLFLDVPENLIYWGLLAFAVLRFGLLSLTVMEFVHHMLDNVSLTFHTSAWYFPSLWFFLVCLVALTSWAFQASIAGRRFWKQELFD